MGRRRTSLTPLTVTTQASPTNNFQSSASLTYTSNPLMLLHHDLHLFFKNWLYLPVSFPLKPTPSGSLDELQLCWKNLHSVIIHSILIVLQIAFLVSLVVLLCIPQLAGLIILYAVLFITGNWWLCRLLLNGPGTTLESQVDLSKFPKRPHEKWIFLNGVAVGKHWLQANIDRIALGFGRPVTGCHNPTCGIVFDTIECLIQRDFNYATEDIRRCFTVIKDAVSDPSIHKVVFILHSQGGIEGGMILDWLYADVPGECTKKLEVYTFGNAANHFNNPVHPPESNNPSIKAGSPPTPSRMSTRSTKRKPPSSSDGSIEVASRRSIRHIEHYANSYDMVARWGVLHFGARHRGNKAPSTSTNSNNRYMGRVFERSGYGHLLNQHYLDAMFPLDDERGWGTKEHGEFVDCVVQEACSTENQDETHTCPPGRVLVRNLTMSLGTKECGCADEPPSPSMRKTGVTVGQLSRLWQYRNGQEPID